MVPIARNFRRLTPKSRFFATFLTAIAALLPSIAEASGYDPQMQEYKIKAAYVFNFLQFTRFEREMSTGFNLCLLGESSVQRAFEQLETRDVNDAPIRLHSVNSDSSLKQCHVLFISRARAAAQREVLNKVSGKQILTIGETSNFLVQGGMIQFVVHESKVRFNCNLDALRSAKVQLSAQLLRLARDVIQ